jgi:hypothetical protein
MVKNAIRTAARLGLVTVEERRREGRRNLSNVVRVVSREWRAWLARGPKPIGVKKVIPTAKTDKREPSRTSEPLFAARRQQAGSAVHHRKGRSYG